MLVADPGHAIDRPGTEPETPWACPASHPIKGYASAESGRRVYYLPGSRFYEEASPERCYASEEEARRDGSHPAGEQLPPRVRDLVRHDSDARMREHLRGWRHRSRLDRNSTSFATGGARAMTDTATVRLGHKVPDFELEVLQS